MQLGRCLPNALALLSAFFLSGYRSWHDATLPHYVNMFNQLQLGFSA